MLTLLTALCALLALAALVLTAAGVWKASFRLGRIGGACFMLAAAAALVLGLEGKYILLASLILLCAAQIGRRNGHEL
ncbi:MAG: hypothetical protein IKH30_04865 [Clostridia bacterium]|nr:hypothetical protein [Clostridia bacterium]